MADLVLVLIFWFRFIKCAWFYMLGIIASNFLKTVSSWTVTEECDTAVVYVGNHLFPQFLENSESHSNAYETLIFLKKHAPLKLERDWLFYGKSVWYYRWPSELQEVWV